MEKISTNHKPSNVLIKCLPIFKFKYCLDLSSAAKINGPLRQMDNQSRKNQCAVKVESCGLFM